MGDQVAHGVDPVVGGGVELVDVERGPPGDLHAGRALAAGLAVLGIGAVEGLGQDPGGRGLAGAARPAEQVGVGHVAVADGALERQDHVRLAPQLPEPAGPEPPVEGDERLVAHGPGAYRRAVTRGGVRYGGQVGYGTRPHPLRAAAFRP